MNADKDDFKERRKYIRIPKNFILTYYAENRPTERRESTQLKNISRGGMCFITSTKFKPGLKLGIELKTPYLADITLLSGTIKESHEKIRNIIYETRLEFDPLNPQSDMLIKKLEEYFRKEKGVLPSHE
jgi:c-di-GMP-binding flagellar brake protein YcgR